MAKTKPREYHTLRDKPLFYALSSVSKLFEDKSIEYVLYGGIGTQFKIASQLAKSQSLETIDDLEKYFRQTSDLDFVVSSETRKIIPKTLYELPKDELFDGELYLTSVERTGETRNLISVTHTTDHKNDQKAEIYLTFYPSDESSMCRTMLAEREKNQLIYNPLASRTYIAPIEHIVASKLTRRNPEKDIPDIANIFKIFDPNMEKIYAILKEKQKEEPDYQTDKIVPIVKKGKKAILDYLLKYQEKSDKNHS